MNDRASSFLTGVLGEPGARAFKKAMQTDMRVACAVVPRAIVSWLDLATKFSYSGNIPGLENTFVEFRKSDRGYSGAISIGSDIYNFTNASPYHLAASVAVALGVDDTNLPSQVRDATLQRLGKSIDTLVKSQVASMAVEKREALKKVISLIPPGPEVRENRSVLAPNSHMSRQGYRFHNFGHVLSPEHQQAGYQLHVLHNPKSGGIHAVMTQRDPVKGLQQVGYLSSIHDGQNLEISNADLHEKHWGKGLGTAMYEAVMAHGFHSGARQVVGDIHSTLASKAHQRVSAKHGMDYQATPTPFPQLIASNRPGRDDNRHGPYNYALKTEEPGTTAKPTPQQEAIKPQAPEFQTQQPKPPGKAQTTRISKSEAGRKCPMCRRVQIQDDTFVGCFCFKDLAKSVSILKADAGGYTLRFDAEWDTDAIRALRESMRE